MKKHLNETTTYSWSRHLHIAKILFPRPVYGERVRVRGRYPSIWRFNSQRTRWWPPLTPPSPRKRGEGGVRVGKSLPSQASYCAGTPVIRIPDPATL